MEPGGGPERPGSIADGGTGRRARPLTRKQRKFVAEYLVDFSATQAAVRAGYSAASAASIGWENLQKPEIQDALKAALAARTVTVDRLVEELDAIALANPADYFGMTDFSGLTRAQASAIRELKYHVHEGDGGRITHVVGLKFHAKQPAILKRLELLRPAAAGTGAAAVTKAGKKAQALEAAKTAGEGTEWGDDLAAPAGTKPAIN